MGLKRWERDTESSKKGYLIYLFGALGNVPGAFYF
jgi:hypothetical protein